MNHTTYLGKYFVPILYRRFVYNTDIVPAYNTNINNAQVVLKTVTDTVIGKQKRTRKPWFNISCKEAFNRRKEARTQLLNYPTNRDKAMVYKNRQKEANYVFRYEKRKYTKYVLEEVKIDHIVNKTRQLYQKINSIRGEYNVQKS